MTSVCLRNEHTSCDKSGGVVTLISEVTGFSFGTKKTVIPKKKVIDTPTLGSLDQVYHSNNEEQNRRSSFFTIL